MACRTGDRALAAFVPSVRRFTSPDNQPNPSRSREPFRARLSPIGSAISIGWTKTIYFKNVLYADRIMCMQSSNNKTKRTRKSAEESVSASLEASGTQAEESAKPRQKRAANKTIDSAPSITNHRKATKKTDRATARATPSIGSGIAAQPVAAEPSTTHRRIEPRIVSHEEIAILAYSYWEGRGYQGGCPIDDWLRAERELRLS